MKSKKVLEINLIGNDYETIIPKGTDARDVEIGLAQALLSIVELEKSRGNKDFKVHTLLEGLRVWCKQLDEHLSE